RAITHKPNNTKRSHRIRTTGNGIFTFYSPHSDANSDPISKGSPQALSKKCVYLQPVGSNTYYCITKYLLEWRRCFVSRSSDWMSGRRSEEHTSELQSRENLVCRLLLEKKKRGGSAHKR